MLWTQIPLIMSRIYSSFQQENLKKKKKKKAPVLTLHLDGLLKTCEIKYTWGPLHPPDQPGLNLHFEQGQKDLKTFETGKIIFYEL